MNNSLPKLKAFKRAPSLGFIPVGKRESNNQPRGNKGHQRSFLAGGSNAGARNRTAAARAHARGRTFLRPGRRVRRICGKGRVQDESWGMCVYAKVQATRVCHPLAWASPPCLVHTCGIGRSFSPLEHTCRTAGTSHSGCHLFDGRSETDGTAAE